LRGGASLALMGQPLTPDDIRNVAFRKPAIGRRGYDEEGVDAFLDEVERSLTVLYDEIARLRSGQQPAYAPAQAYPAPAPSTSDGAVLGELTQIRATLARIEAAVGPQRGGNPMF